MRKVERTSTGRWKVRFRHGYSAKTGKPKQTSEVFDTKKEAETFARWVDAYGVDRALEMLYEHEADKLVPTLDQLATEHIGLRPNTTDGTRLNYERLWARTWGPLVGGIPANRVTEDDLAKAVMVLGARYSRKSLENQRGLLSGVVGRAVKKNYLAENIARGMPLPAGVHGDQAEMRILTPDEFDLVIGRVPAHYCTFVRFLYASGARWGEAVALQVQDVTFDTNPRTRQPVVNIRIRRALKWSPDNKRTIGGPKTARGNRTVQITAELHDELARLCAGKQGTDLVFTAPRGGMILHRTFWSRVWLPAVGDRVCAAHRREKAKAPIVACPDCQVGLSPRPRIHDLRHSHASLLLGRGVPIHVVQRRLGHNSIQVTVDTYSHLLPDAQEAAALASSFAFATESPGPTGLEDRRTLAELD